MRISPKVGVLLLLTLGLCVGVQAQGKHSNRSHWRACMQLAKVSYVYVSLQEHQFFFAN